MYYMQSQGPLTVSAVFLSCYTFTVLTAYSTLRQTHMLKLQRFKCKTHGFLTFSHFGPHIWNNLPQDIRHSATLSSFKSKLKTSLRIFQLSNTVHHPCQSVQCVCACVHVCGCMLVCVCVCVCIFCIVTLKPSTTLFSSFFLYIWACDKRCSRLTRVCLYAPIYFRLTRVTWNCGCFYSVCIDE